ncbi:alpha-galactosidase [Sunxiuqinia dokdonensis]|nr:alpha-galactosidase [Sunxiuqinia dokdonensis]
MKNIKVIQKLCLSFLLVVTGAIVCHAERQVKECEAYLSNDTLVIRNSKIEQKWLWYSGDIRLYSTKELNSGDVMSWNPHAPSFALEGSDFIKNIKLEINQMDETVLMPEHLEVSIENQYGQLFCRRVFRIFPGIGAFPCDFYLKYHSLASEQQVQNGRGDGTEKSTPSISQNGKSYLAYLGFSSKHVRLKVINFKDATDTHDNLVFMEDILPYQLAQRNTGNLILGEDLISENQFFILKEAPNSASQINYPGYDFVVSQRGIELAFAGFPVNGNPDEWIKGYTFTMGFSGTNTDCLFALRKYLKGSINYEPQQYEMVMMNTWGDRGQDGKISERFILKELEKAQELGISHFQIDDGWQQGLSANSIHQSGNLWDAWSPENWQPNKERFPNGLTEILESAEAKGIRLGLWFHPSNQNSYATWEIDADILVNLYRETGIAYFKIDGVEIADKEAAINLEKFFSKVKKETNGAAFFNLDLTAGVRGGYFSYRPFGNLFLENRYTDWGNYYPFRTLRNVWNLAHYFPPELLQIEFLNKWRNADKYPDNDLFAPSNYDFDYLFAIAMVGQPLAWFEATGLTDEASGIAETITKYRTIQNDFHSGYIFPIGDEPTGRSWTGFQSVHENRGYFLVFRERTEASSAQIQAYLLEGEQVSLQLVLGDALEESLQLVVSENGTLKFNLPKANSYVLYRYTVE